MALALISVSFLLLIAACFQRMLVRAGQILLVANRYTDVVLGLVEGPQTFWRCRPLFKVLTTLNLTPQPLEGQAKMVRSSEGVPFQVNFRLMFRINLDRLDLDQLTENAFFLANPKAGLLAQAEDYLRWTFADFDAEEILMASNRWALMDEFRQQMADPLLNQGFQITVVNLREITAPSPYQQSQLAAHGRQIENEADISALNHLARGTGGINPDDRRWIASMERLRTMRSIRGNTTLHMH